MKVWRKSRGRKESRNALRIGKQKTNENQMRKDFGMKGSMKGRFGRTNLLKGEGCNIPFFLLSNKEYNLL